MNPDINQVVPLTKKEFWAKYWFSPLQMVTLKNPKQTDYNFMVEMRNFVVRAGATETMPGTVANVYLSQMTRIMAQDDEKMEHLSDFNLMKIYFDKLIVNVKDMMRETNNQPAYLKDVPTTMRGEAPETPPWQAPVGSTIPVTNSDMKNTWDAPKQAVAPITEEPPKETKESVKEFEFEGGKFKMVVDKNNNETYFRDGRRVKAADYAKAASML